VTRESRGSIFTQHCSELEENTAVMEVTVGGSSALNPDGTANGCACKDLARAAAVPPTCCQTTLMLNRPEGWLLPSGDAQPTNAKNPIISAACRLRRPVVAALIHKSVHA
jgi:hypothetical protein